MRRGGEIDEVERSKNRIKSKVRARVEHVFAVVKRLWGFNKVRYRGLAKNATRAFVALGLANIYPRAKNHCMDKCAHSGRSASQWLAARPQKPRPAAQCASHPRSSTRYSVNSSLPHKVATGWRAAATCSALP